nr:hypothetical protein [Tanacetum cinerariifolium]
MIVNSGGGQNQKDNPELVKPALSTTPPKPTSNSDEDAYADQVKPEDVALESGDISTLNSLVGNESPRTLQLYGTIGLETKCRTGNPCRDKSVTSGIIAGRFEAMANETEKIGASGSVVDENRVETMRVNCLRRE